MSEPLHEGIADAERGWTWTVLLERGDEFAHLLVSAFLLLTALAVLGACTWHLVSDVLRSRTSAEDFGETALTYLSNLLFAVILLELLSTLLTYVKSKNLESTIKDFLIVGIISSVRKILLVGAHSSLAQGTTDDFVKEAIGTVITIVGILLLIGGLLLLERRRATRV
jgi:phosphate starvation-inducible membrane PsiE